MKHTFKHMIHQLLVQILLYKCLKVLFCKNLYRNVTRVLLARVTNPNKFYFTNFIVAADQGAASLTTSGKMTIWWRHKSSLWCNWLPFYNSPVWWWRWRWRHSYHRWLDFVIRFFRWRWSNASPKKWRRHDDLALIVNDAAPLAADGLFNDFPRSKGD